ncbi:M23 family metallopeptidase [Oceanidesulfovibrio indonesiensis]|nr:M23 family metallopeptidase [Oceanidesulfovibrio indonesiensis]
MFLKKYKLLIFRNNEGSCRVVPFWGVILPGVALAFLLLAGSTLYLWNTTREYDALLDRREELEITISAQHAQLLARAGDVFSLADKTRGIEDFNAKLGVMLSFDRKQDRMSRGGASGYLGKPMPVALMSERQLTRALHGLLDDMNTSLAMEETVQQQIIAAMAIQSDEFARIPSIWPVRGRFSSPFGYRINPITKQRHLHKGIDVTAKRGTPVRAPADGVVVYAQRFSSYGLTMEIRHSPRFKTRYAHLSAFEAEVGQKVKRGQVVARVGNTGRSTASHLHYEVHVDGRLKDPMQYILN